MVNRIEAILGEIADRPEQRTCAIARNQGVGHMTVWHVFCEERLHHFQGVQALNV